MLVYPKIPSKLAMKAFRIDIVADPLPQTLPLFSSVPVSRNVSKLKCAGPQNKLLFDIRCCSGNPTELNQ